MKFNLRSRLSTYLLLKWGAICLISIFIIIEYFTALTSAWNFASTMIFLAVASLSALALQVTARLIDKTFPRLQESLRETRSAHKESEAARAALVKTMAELGQSKERLEEKIGQRTSELEEAKSGLEKKVAERTADLEESRQAILHMMRDLKEDMSKLQTIDRLKTEFLSMISHELRTPITPIRGYVTMFAKGELGQLSDKQKEAIAVVNRQSSHLQDLIESLLDVSRIELGKPIPAKKEKISLAVLVKEVAEAAEVTLANNNIKLKLEIKEQLPEIMGDKIKLKRVLSNLIGNTVKFTHENDEILVRLFKEDNNLRVEVIDHGIGIAEENLEKVFEKFFQIDSSVSRSAGGIGMGLAIARELVELHGGHIWAESKGLGKGTKFVFTLPIT